MHILVFQVNEILFSNQYTKPGKEKKKKKKTTLLAKLEVDHSAGNEVKCKAETKP